MKKKRKEKELKEIRRDLQSKLKAYEKKKKMYTIFCISKSKNN